MSHPTSRLNDVVHHRARLGVLAVLAEARRVDFGYLKQTLGLTDGNLSGHLQVLEEAGYVTLEKTFEGKRPRTWVVATKKGQQAFKAEVEALKQIVGQSAPR